MLEIALVLAFIYNSFLYFYLAGRVKRVKPLFFSLVLMGFASITTCLFILFSWLPSSIASIIEPFRDLFVAMTSYGTVIFIVFIIIWFIMLFYHFIFSMKKVLRGDKP